MRSWFEFGYNGFPSGEQRKRFFRQRDDPCGSEDDNDFDDETNDRPIFYYPLRSSEEGSSPSASNGIPSDEDEDDGDSADEPPISLYGHTAVYESAASRYGATALTFLSELGPHPRARAPYVLWHGGASVAERQVTSDFAVAALRRGGLHGELYPSSVECLAVPVDTSVVRSLSSPLSHPALRACTVPSQLGGRGCGAVPRFGHCAAYVDLPGELARKLLVEGLIAPTTDDSGRTVCPPVGSFLAADTVGKEDYEVHLSLVLGGCSKLPDDAVSLPSSLHRASWGGEGRGCDPASRVSAERIAVMRHVRTTTMSRPALCFTVLRRTPASGTVSCWNQSFDFSADASLMIGPRMFATLTPWPLRRASMRSYAYCGGTETGLDPVPLFALTLIQLDCRSWRWSSVVEPTLGAEPASRFGHSTCCCGTNLFVYGGVGKAREFLNDLHVLDTQTRVWREVFIPLRLGVPPRAFHCVVVLPPPHDSQAPGRSRKDAFATEEHIAPRSVHSGTMEEEKTAHLDSEDSAGQLLLLGGEGTAGPEPSVWLHDVDAGTWRPCHFPLFTQPQSYHVLTGARQEASTAEAPPRAQDDTYARASPILLTPSRLQQTVRALAERHQVGLSAAVGACDLHTAVRCVPSATQESLGREAALFFSAVHGSLAQAIRLPAQDAMIEDDGGALVFGGTCSPPVLLATHVQLPEGSLKECAAFWLFSSPHSMSSHVVRGAPTYFSRVLGGTRFSQFAASVLDASASKLASSTARKNIIEDGAYKDCVPDNARDTDGLVRRVVLDEQLALWARAAKRRLREDFLNS